MPGTRLRRKSTANPESSVVQPQQKLPLAGRGCPKRKSSLENVGEIAASVNTETVLRFCQKAPYTRAHDSVEGGRLGTGLCLDRRSDPGENGGDFG
jgi:hypothetical protein